MDYQQSPEAMEAQAELRAEKAHTDAMRAATVQTQQAAAARLQAQATLLNMAAFAIMLLALVGSTVLVVAVIL